MKNIRCFIGIQVVALVFGLTVFGCASSGGSAAGGDAGNSSVVAGPGETIVVITRESAFAGAAVKHEVNIDGRPVMELTNGATGRIVVANGEHTIYTRILRPTADKPMSERLTFIADSTEIHFTTKNALNNAVLTKGL